MRRLTLILFLTVFAGLSTLMAQTKTITGTVTDSEDGQPIPGVSINTTPWDRIFEGM